MNFTFIDIEWLMRRWYPTEFNWNKINFPHLLRIIVRTSFTKLKVLISSSKEKLLGYVYFRKWHHVRQLRVSGFVYNYLISDIWLCLINLHERFLYWCSRIHCKYNRRILWTKRTCYFTKLYGCMYLYHKSENRNEFFCFDKQTTGLWVHENISKSKFNFDMKRKWTEFGLELERPDFSSKIIENIIELFVEEMFLL